MNIFVKTFVTQPVSTNTHLVIDEEKYEAMIVDPSGTISEYFYEIRNSRAKLKYIVATHMHFDHIAGVADLKEEFPEAKVMIPKDSVGFITDSRKNASAGFYEVKEFGYDLELSEGDEVKLGESVFQVISVPGHVAHHVALINPEVVFVGDLIFASGVGRTDLYSGDYAQIHESVKKVKSTLRNFKDCVVYTGHGKSLYINDLGKWCHKEKQTKSRQK